MSNATDEPDRTPDAEQRPHGAVDGPSDASTDDRLDDRLRAVERALTGTDAAVADLTDEAAAASERETLRSRVDDLESRVEELEAATQAIRGYVGAIRAVNREVERRADLALARANRRESPRGMTDEGETTASVDEADGAVPTEAALDAAVPSDRNEGLGGDGRVRSGADGSAAGVDEADESWRDGALERLRESL